MAQQPINYGTNPNDGTGDTLRDAFIKTDDNFTELYDNKLALTGTEVGAPITGEVVFDDDVFATFEASTGALDSAQINGQQILIQGENSTSILNSFATICYGNNAGSIIKQIWEYNSGTQTFNFPTLGSSDNFQVNWPAKGGTVAFLDDIAAGSGTVTSVAALTLDTTGTDLSSTVANGTTTPVITLNVPTASATNRGALSSADWTTFNNKVSMLHSSNVQSATHTGTTANTLVTSYLISANSIADNQTLEIEAKLSKINTQALTWNARIYINTSASLTGATEIGLVTVSSAANAQTATIRRRVHRRGANILYYPVAASNISDFAIGATTALTSTACDFTVNQYIILAVQLNATAQQVVVETINITRI